MNGQVSDEFKSRCEIDEPFDQFVVSFSDHRLLTSTAAVNFTRAPLIDVCASSYAAVRHDAVGLRRNWSPPFCGVPKIAMLIQRFDARPVNRPLLVFDFRAL